MLWFHAKWWVNYLDLNQRWSQHFFSCHTKKNFLIRNSSSFDSSQQKLPTTRRNIRRIKQDKPTNSSLSCPQNWWWNFKHHVFLQDFRQYSRIRKHCLGWSRRQKYHSDQIRKGQLWNYQNFLRPLNGNQMPWYL